MYLTCSQERPQTYDPPASLPSTRIPGICYCTGFMQCWGSNPGLCALPDDLPPQFPKCHLSLWASSLQHSVSCLVAAQSSMGWIRGCGSCLKVLNAGQEVTSEPHSSPQQPEAKQPWNEQGPEKLSEPWQARSQPGKPRLHFSESRFPHL